jgi:hypothetical protein
MLSVRRLYCVKTHSALTPNRPAYSPYAERLDAVLANMDDRMAVWLDALERGHTIGTNKERFDSMLRAADNGIWIIRRDIKLYQHYRKLEIAYWETNRMPRYPADVTKQIALLQEKLKEMVTEE